MTARPIDQLVLGSARRVGAAAAIALWLPVGFAFLVSTPTLDVRHASLAIAGVVVSGTVGSIFGTSAARSAGLPFSLALAFSFVAVLVGSLVWSLTFVVLDGHPIADTLGFALVGLIFMGVPLAIVAFYLALLWAVVVRRAMRRAGA